VERSGHWGESPEKAEQYPQAHGAPKRISQYTDGDLNRFICFMKKQIRRMGQKT
jgi:hypothetical protein